MLPGKHAATEVPDPRAEPNEVRQDPAVLSKALLVAVFLYPATQWLAYATTIQPGSTVVFWPHAGVILAVFLMLERSRWPLAIVLLLVVSMLCNWLTGQALSFNVLISLKDVAVGLFSVWIYRIWADHKLPIADTKTIGRFFAITLLGAALSALGGATIMVLLHGAPVSETWLTRFGATVLGTLLVTPAILSISTTKVRGLLEAVNTEFLLIAALTAVFLFISYWSASGSAHIVLATALLILPCLIWISVRFDVALSTVSLALVSMVETYAIAQGLGPQQFMTLDMADKIGWVMSGLTIRAAMVLLLTMYKSQRAQLLKTQREQSARLTSIVEAAQDGIIVIDELGTILDFSKVAERQFGYAAHSVVGQNVSMLMPEYHRQRHDQYLRRYAETGERRIIGTGRVVAGQRKDGSTFPMELTVGESMNDQQRLFTGFIRDISEKQQTTRRMHELQEQVLFVSRFGAAGELASALAHELNQPLAAIKNYAEAGRLMLSKKRPSTEDLSGVLSKTVAQAERAGDMIRKLRALVASRKIAQEAHDIRDLIDEACALAFVGASPGDIDLRVNHGECLGKVFVDRVQIQIVLTNLIRNAVEAMQGQRGGKLTISSEYSGRNVLIHVADTGPGVAAQMEVNLFKPFTTSKMAGMGVGLSLSRNIAEAHGGSLRHAPNPGGGAIFTLSLPLHPAAGNGSE